MSILTAAGVLFYVFTRPEPFDPISFAPDPRRVERLLEVEVGSADVVRVVPRVEGFDAPSVRLGETVPTSGVVCNSTDAPVGVLGDLVWERWDVRGLRVQVFDDLPGTIDPGCSPLAFENPIPDAVADAVRSSGEAQQWIISGSATPTAPEGVAATWRIESFWIVP